MDMTIGDLNRQNLHANFPILLDRELHSRHMRNSGGGVFIPPVDVSHIVKPREQTTEELEVRVQSRYRLCVS